MKREDRTTLEETLEELPPQVPPDPRQGYGAAIALLMRVVLDQDNEIRELQQAAPWFDIARRRGNALQDAAQDLERLGAHADAARARAALDAS